MQVPDLRVLLSGKTCVLTFVAMIVQAASVDDAPKMLTSLQSSWEVSRRPASARPGRKGIFSEGGEVIKLHIESSLTIPTAWIKRV